MSDENGEQNLLEILNQEKENLKDIDAENYIYKIQNFFSSIYNNMKTWSQRVIKLFIVISVLYTMRAFIRRFWCGSFCITSSY